MDYLSKDKSYFQNARLDILGLLPENRLANLLEVGASGGYTLVAAKELAKCGYAAGIELFALPNTEQSNPQINQFIIGNIESDAFQFEQSFFDILLFPDVLEHLVNPWEVLENCLQWLKPGGICIISIPNIQYWKVMMKIFFRGDFCYTENGILDKTHLRFFCKKNAESLAETGPLKLQSIYSSFELQQLRKMKLANSLTFGLAKPLLTVQYIMVSKKAT